MFAQLGVNITVRENITDGPFAIGEIGVAKHEQMKTNRI